jgi:hypothetical protein
LQFGLQAVLAVVPVNEGLGGDTPVAGPLDGGLTGRYAAGMPVIDRGDGFNFGGCGDGRLRAGRFRRFLPAGLQQQGG